MVNLFAVFSFVCISSVHLLECEGVIPLRNQPDFPTGISEKSFGIDYKEFPCPCRKAIWKLWSNRMQGMFFELMNKSSKSSMRL